MENMHQAFRRPPEHSLRDEHFTATYLLLRKYTSINNRIAIIQHAPEGRCQIVAELGALYEMGVTLATTKRSPGNDHKRAAMVRHRDLQIQALKQRLNVGKHDYMIEAIAEAEGIPWEDQCDEGLQRREIGLKTALTELTRNPQRFVDNVGRLHETPERHIDVMKELWYYIKTNTRALPPTSERLSGLVATGQQFPDQRDWRVPVGHDLTHSDWNGSEVPALVDMRVAERIPKFYALDPTVQTALEAHQLQVRPVEELASGLGEDLASNQLIVGFSGYATSSSKYNYTDEARGVARTFAALQDAGYRPKLAVDSGTSLGVPGLSGLVAEEAKIATLGCLPLEGLRSIAPRDRMVVVGSRYGDETRLLGAIPDILVAVGGGPNAIKEYQVALRLGTRVLMLILKDYPANSLARNYKQLPETEPAQQAGRLAICHSVAEIPERVQALAAAEDIREGRAQRLEAIRSMLAA